jgi:hypothetical protein
MKIILSPSVSMNLEALMHQVGNREFSGIGFCHVVEGNICCYEILLLDVGSAGYSEIPCERLTNALEKRADRDNARLWFHRHPIEGWSTTDLETITKAPLGGIPEMVRWSASIVRTPTRWIGRVDNHLNHAHKVVEVEPNIDPKLIAQSRDLLAEYWNTLDYSSTDKESCMLQELNGFEMISNSCDVLEEESDINNSGKVVSQ